MYFRCARRWIGLLVGGVLAFGLVGCEGGSDSGTDDAGQLGDVDPDGAGEASDADPIEYEDADVPLPDGGGIVEDLEVVPNPSNALSYYVEWTSTEPADTELFVDCGGDWRQSYGDEELVEEHTVFVMGLWEGANCRFTASSRADDGSPGGAVREVEVGPLPDFLPDLTVRTREPDEMQTGWTMFNLTNGFDGVPLTVAMVDSQGRYRWYHQRSVSHQGSDTEVRPMDDGVLIGGDRGYFGPAKIDWEGSRVWSSDTRTHHDIRPGGEEGQVYFLRHVDKCEQDFRSDSMVEFSVDSDQDVAEWVLCDYWTPGSDLGHDWSHLNTIEPFDDEEETFLLSSRTQHSLIKFDAADEEVDWKLGEFGDFGLWEDEQSRFYRQHAPEIQPDGNIVLFDNGTPDGGQYSRTFSRAVEISYDTETMEAEIVWEFRPDPDLFTPIWGDADRLQNGNTLVTFGHRDNSAERNSRIMEVTGEGDKIWDLEAPNKWGWYRSDRLVDPPVGYVE